MYFIFFFSYFVGLERGVMVILYAKLCAIFGTKLSFWLFLLANSRYFTLNNYFDGFKNLRYVKT